MKDEKPSGEFLHVSVPKPTVWRFFSFLLRSSTSSLGFLPSMGAHTRRSQWLCTGVPFYGVLHFILANDQHSSRMLPAVQQLCSSGKPQWAQEAETLLNQKKRGRLRGRSFILSQPPLYNSLQYRWCGVWWNSGFTPSEDLIKDFHSY